MCRRVGVEESDRERDGKLSMGGGLLTLLKTDAGALPRPTEPSRPVSGSHTMGIVGV